MEQHVSQQYDEQAELSEQSEGDAADVEQTEEQVTDAVQDAVQDEVEDQPADEADDAEDGAEDGAEDEAAGLQPGQSPDPELEAVYGEPDEGPEVEDDPRL